MKNQTNNEKTMSEAMNISKSLKNKLIKQIAILGEKQYRKGFQHGARFYDDGLLTVDEVNRFRWDGSSQGYEKAISPLNWSKKLGATAKDRKKSNWKKASRISCEIDFHTELGYLLFEYNQK